MTSERSETNSPRLDPDAGDDALPREFSPSSRRSRLPVALEKEEEASRNGSSGGKILKMLGEDVTKLYWS